MNSADQSRRQACRVLRQAGQEHPGTRMVAVGVPMRALQELVGHRETHATLVHAGGAAGRGASLWRLASQPHRPSRCRIGSFYVASAHKSAGVRCAKHDPSLWRALRNVYTS
jgi:hypothetical protein